MISRFFIWCSGASIEILKKCPQTETSKFTAIGASIFMTAIFSFVSFTYAANEIFRNIILSVVIGLFWGFIIFNLDRFMVMSMTKTERFSKDMMIALPRVVLSCIIAIVIARPLELRIFQDRIYQTISDANLPNDFITQLQVYMQLQDSNIEIKYMSIAILLLFILMELSPVLLRLISPRGPYDKLLSRSQKFEVSFLDKTKNELEKGNLGGTINNLFHIAEINKNSSLESKIKKIAIQIKYLEEEIKQNTIEENFASKELIKTGFELRQIIQTLSDNSDKIKLPSSQKLEVGFDEIPENLQGKAIEFWK